MNDHHTTTGTGDFDLGIAKSLPVSERPTLRDVLSPEEIDLLGRYVGNAETQVRLAGQEHVAQTTISYRLRQAAKKLKAAGMPVVLPGRGRRPMVRDYAIDPAAIGCLVGTGAADGAGRPRMKWKKARKIDSDDSDRQW